jgi:hypothetical protein
MGAEVYFRGLGEGYDECEIDGCIWNYLNQSPLHKLYTDSA